MGAMGRTMVALGEEMRASLRHILDQGPEGDEEEDEEEKSRVEALIKRLLEGRGSSSSSSGHSEESALEGRMHLASALSAIQESIEGMVQKWEEKEKPRVMAKVSKHWNTMKRSGEQPPPLPLLIPHSSSLLPPSCFLHLN